MNVASKNCISNILTARDYVQDGLVAMFDGIENAGWGVHDPNATTWMNLVSGSAFSNFALQSGKHFKGDHLVVDGYTAVSEKAWPTSLTSYLVLEKCYRIDSGCAFFNLNISSRIEWYLTTGYGVFSGVSSNNKAFYDSDFQFGFHNSLSIHYKPKDNGASAVFLNGKKIEDIRNSTQSTLVGSLVSIGKRPQVSSQYNNATGILNCIRLYSRHLTDAEVAHNYAVDKERFGLS